MSSSSSSSLPGSFALPGSSAQAAGAGGEAGSSSVRSSIDRASSLQHLLDSEMTQLNAIDFDAGDPEQVLKNAYELRAQSEVERCLGAGKIKDLCDYNMDLLAESCDDPSMYVAACDDPRLAAYWEENRARLATTQGQPVLEAAAAMKE